MSTSQRRESPLVRFLDSFLQEKNIKWVLATGLLILLGSSLMMVTKGWTEFDPTIKFLVIIGYTSAIFAAGQWSYHHLALRKTGTVLMALTVLMIPATFIAWHWLWFSIDSTATRGVAGGLLILNTGLAALAAQKTFVHFLRGNQVTFVVSFLLLSIAGAVAPAVRGFAPIWSWLGALALWAVFSIGVLKVNRHVFWLTEEHRQPRIFGFFPIALLGMQFLLVFATNFAAHFPVDWFGLACVLVAVPVLLTADSVTRVFQERTGDIVRPIPWPIMLPLCVGLVLCVGGIGLAGSGLATGIPYALVPTAALAAAMMGVVARRTNRSAFVWAMLACVLLAYNFSPIFFQELARSALEQGARAVDESRLPYAFYGLTYLPLIVASLAVAAWTKSRGNELFSRPLRQFVVGLCTLLLIVAFGHVKALFPVAILMTGMFASMAVLLGDRRLALPGLTAFLISSSSAAPFAGSAWAQVHPSAAALYGVPLVAASALLLIGPWLDRCIRSLPLPGKFLASSELFRQPTLLFSFAATALIAAAWVPRFLVPEHDLAVWTALAIGGLLWAHSLVWMRKTTSGICVAFAAVEGLHCGMVADLTVGTMVEIATLTGLAAWVVTYGLERRPQWRISRAWTEVGRLSALTVLSLTTCCFAIPGMLGNFVDVPFLHSPDLLWWCCCALLTIWCFDAARRLRQPVTTCIGCASLLTLVSWTFVEVAGNRAVEWLPLVWAITAVAALPLLGVLRRVVAQMDTQIVTADAYRSVRMVQVPTEVVVRGLLVVLTGVSLVFYDVPLMVAGGVAMVGLVGSAIRRRALARLLPMAVLANWFVIIVVAQGFSQARHFAELVLELPTLSACLVAVLAATSVLGWQGAIRLLPQWRPVAIVQITILRCVAGLGLLATLPQAVVSSGHVSMATLAFLIMAGSEFWFACSRHDVRRVWTGLAILTAAFAYLGWFDVLHYGSGLSMFLPLIVGGGLTLAATVARRYPQTELLAGPCFAVGLRMPLLTVVIAIGRHFTHGDDIVWRGFNSLALLAASGFYFWHAIERRSKSFAVQSAAIMNVALMLLFRELKLSDPQFYMVPIGISVLVLVEVLKREIPTVWHNPLRYAGALVILVSPTFHIIGQSWLPMLSLMVTATAVLLVAIGLRIRALMYTGAAFLVADLVAMVVRGGIEHPNLVWIVGIGFGAAVLTLGAVLENNREKMLQRLRAVSAQLEQWS